MLELGESPKTVQTMLGHSRVAITLDIYSHVSLELEKKAAPLRLLKSPFPRLPRPSPQGTPEALS